MGVVDHAVLSSEMKGRAKAQFDAWAGAYDRSPLNRFLFRPSYITLMEEVARWHAEHRRTFRVLDVGTGTGTMVGLLARSSWPVSAVGLDYAARMCSAADDKARLAGHKHRARFVNGDSEHLPFADATFDVITCSNSFHHYPHQRAVVAEMHRLLTPEGRLIIIDGFRDCAIGWVVFDVIVNHLEKQVYHAPWPVMHEHFEESGFRNIRRRKFNFLIPAFATIGDK